MKRILCLAAAGLALLIPGSAYAGPITSNITAFSPTAGTLSGTVTVDTSTGQVTSVDLTLTQGIQTFVFDTVDYQVDNNGTEYYFTSYDDGGTGPDAILIAFDDPNLTNFTIATPLCTEAETCGSGYGSFFAPGSGGADFFENGTPTLTPEPSSLVLLGTGVLGIAGMVRRRFVAL